MERQRLIDESPLRLAGALSLAFALALSLADVLQTARAHGLRPASAIGLFLPMASLFVAVCAASFALAALALWVARRAGLLPPAAAFGAVFGVCSGTSVMLVDWPAGTFGDAQLGGLSAVVALGGALLGYGAARWERPFDLLLRGMLVLPVPLALAFVAYAARAGSAEWLRSGVATLGQAALLGACSLAALWGLARPGRHRRAEAVLGALALTLLLSVPVARVWDARGHDAPPMGSAGAGHEAPRIILLSIDTLRSDAIGALSEGALTPGLDALAADSVVFENAYSPAPWTYPSFVSIMTGVYPTVHSVRDMGQKLSDRVPMMAERLRDAGYLTGAIGDNFFLTSRGSRGAMQRGFDHHDVFPRSQPHTGAQRILERVLQDPLGFTRGTVELTELAKDWIGEHRDRDFFLWLHYFDPHSPYQPPEEFQPPGEPAARVGRAFDSEDALPIKEGTLVLTADEISWVRKLYDGEVRFVDAEVARLMDWLKELDLYDDALVIVTSDHGEELFDRGGFNHGHSLFQELVRVPLFIKLPRSELRSTLDAPVSTVSIQPTILDLSGVAYDASDFSAASLVRHWREPGAVPEPLYAGSVIHGEDRDAVVDGQIKFVRSLESPAEQLFDLESDPRELEDLAPAGGPELAAARLRLDALDEAARLMRIRLSLEAEGDFDLGKDEREMLKELGYIE
jgi:arylsulfatase A-like enzyme